jgi:hypothetical protein
MPAAGETTRTIEQLVVIDTLLARPGGVTLQELAKKLGCGKQRAWTLMSSLTDVFNLCVTFDRPSVDGEKRYRYSGLQAGVFRDEVRHAHT